MELRDRLIVGQRTTLMDLVVVTEDRARQVLITFLSLLELGKMGFVGLYQSETYSDIYVDAKKQIEADIISRVEEYDSMNAEEIAAKMMDKSKKEAAAAMEEEDFVLTDAEDNLEAEGGVQLALGEQLEEGVDFASDEEILAAENELFKDEAADV
ncbi:segregation and condensation protein A [compost metagenome]